MREISNSTDKTLDGLRIALCEIFQLCRTNKKRKRSFTWTWIAFTRRSKSVIALRCVANPWESVARVSGVAF